MGYGPTVITFPRRTDHSAQNLPLDSEEPLKEPFQLINHGLLLLGSGTTATKAGYRRHQLVNVRHGGLDLAVTGRIIQEFPYLRLFELFLLNP